MVQNTEEDFSNKKGPDQPVRVRQGQAFVNLDVHTREMHHKI